MEDQAQRVGQIIGSVADGVGCGFALLMFERGAGPGRWSTYVSNCNRADMVEALREQARILEERGEVPPVREQN